MEVIFSDREQNWLIRYAFDNRLSTAAVVRMAVKKFMVEQQSAQAEKTRSSPESEEPSHG